jgi:hypothetical protein
MSNNRQQTAVEWLFKETLGITLQLANKRISQRNWELQMVKLHKQAKKMEKEQHENTWDDSFLFKDDWEMKFEQYYNETYGGNKCQETK